MWLAALVNAFIVALSVLIHYEFLYRATTLVPKVRIKHRFRIVMVVFIALIANGGNRLVCTGVFLHG